MSLPAIDRLYDLLALRETGLLTPAEEAELRELQAKWPHVEPDELTRVAALVQAATAPAADPSPDFLDRLEADAALHFNPPRPIEPAPARRPRVLEWCVAASLVIFVGVEGWRLWDQQQNRQPVALSAAEEREKLLTAGAKQFPAKAGGGDVVWDAGTQRGYLSVSGLPANDPAKSQYQLWIVDAGRAHKEPVDGGVFDVGPDGRAVVPIKAALTVREPVLFAVTVEPPGGVVVSERGKEGKFEAVFAP
jgi:anti-sigma-K factor RskA